MKWSVFGLIILGVAAAVFAALLMSSLNVSRAAVLPALPKETAILLAAHDMRASAVLTENDISTRTISLDHVTVRNLRDPAQAIGRMLVTPLTKGQALTEDHFVPAGPGAKVALNLPPGTRAISLSLTNASSIRGLLYPGCRVDVLVSFRVQRASETSGEALSTTLLENVQVLAIEDRIIGRVGDEAEEDEEEGVTKKTQQSSGNGKTMVTVAVHPRQAEALQLAMEYGSLSLAMRNPADGEKIDSDATLLSGGRLAKMAALLQSSVGDEPLEERILGDRLDMIASATPVPTPEPAPAPTTEAVAPVKPKPTPVPMWEITVIRGVDIEKRSYSLK